MLRRARLTVLSGLLLSPLALAQQVLSPSPITPPPAPAAAPMPPAEPEAMAVVEVNGVETLNDYATIGRLLGAAEGVRRVDVSAAGGGTVTFRVLVRGGGTALEHTLESVAQLARAPTSAAGRLVYEYRR